MIGSSSQVRPSKYRPLASFDPPLGAPGSPLLEKERDTVGLAHVAHACRPFLKFAGIAFFIGMLLMAIGSQTFARSITGIDVLHASESQITDLSNSIFSSSRSQHIDAERHCFLSNEL